MAQTADPRRRARRDGSPGPAALALRTVAPAAYGAALLGGLFAPDRGLRPAALAVLAAFIAYFLWRIHALVARSAAPDLERAEVGLLAALALSTALEAAGIPPAWSLTAHAVLLVGLAASVSFPAILVLPLAAVPLWKEALPNLVHLELVAGVSGLTFLLERRRSQKLQRALDKLSLDQEHLEGQVQEGTHKGELSEFDDLLYDYLQQVKEHAGAHGAVLAVTSRQGQLFVRELVTDSPSIREDRVFNLDGTTFQWVLENRKPLTVGRLGDASARLGYYAGSVGVKSFIGVPVLKGDEVQGVLALDHLREEAFGEAHLTMLKVAAHQVSTILSKIGEVERWKRTSRDFEHLYEFFKSLVGSKSVPEMLGLFLGAVETRLQPEFCALALVTPEGRLRLESVSGPLKDQLAGKEFDPKGGLAGWVLQHEPHWLHFNTPRARARRPLFSAGMAEPPFGSLILQALRAGTHELGVLCVAKQGPKAFDGRAVQFCDFIAQAGAQGISLLRASAELERLATTDALTGLANRRLFFDELTAEILRSRRYEHGLALLLLDADHFKKINDLHGHPAGDAVLRAVAQALGGLARETDLPARYGGEEFAVLLPSTTEEGARTLAERVRAGVEALRVEWEGKPIPVRVSVGLATLEGEKDNGDALVARADQALYAAKQTGRNRVVSYSEIREYASWK